METSTIAANSRTSTQVITSEQLLKHWQGHRNLTRRVIEAFPEDEFFKFSIGGMRTFADLAMEMIRMAVPGIRGVVTGKWETAEGADIFNGVAMPATRKEVLQLWDNVTEEIDTYWPQIPPQRFQEVEAAFGRWENPIYSTILYFIDNEIHHRGQGFVYLRALGIEPPYFYER